MKHDPYRCAALAVLLLLLPTREAAADTKGPQVVERLEGTALVNHRPKAFLTQEGNVTAIAVQVAPATGHPSRSPEVWIWRVSGVEVVETIRIDDPALSRILEHGDVEFRHIRAIYATPDAGYGLILANLDGELFQLIANNAGQVSRLEPMTETGIAIAAAANVGGSAVLVGSAQGRATSWTISKYDEPISRATRLDVGSGIADTITPTTPSGYLVSGRSSTRSGSPAFVSVARVSGGSLVWTRALPGRQVRTCVNKDGDATAIVDRGEDAGLTTRFVAYNLDSAGKVRKTFDLDGAWSSLYWTAQLHGGDCCFVGLRSPLQPATGAELLSRVTSNEVQPIPLPITGRYRVLYGAFPYANGVAVVAKARSTADGDLIAADRVAIIAVELVNR